MEKKLDLPKDHYVTAFDIQLEHLKVTLEPRKKIALVMISLGERYWPYLSQCLNDCRERFLTNHNVDYFVWTDFSTKTIQENINYWKDAPKRYNEAEKKSEVAQEIVSSFVQLTRNKEVFNNKLCQEQMGYLASRGVVLRKTSAANVQLESTIAPEEAIKLVCNTSLAILLDSYQTISKSLKKAKVIDTDNMDWPMPTLMRYHLFLHEEEKLKDYDYIYYLDADMRVVQPITEEIFSEGLTCAPHPGYVLNPKHIPPYEPNIQSAAYIHRLHTFSNENGKSRLIPFYAAGGFQGGTAGEFIKAMKEMRAAIDKDFNQNYMAIWNDESHFNRYLWDYQKSGGKIKFLDVSYVMPDSLIKEYYEPLWGRTYEPKIISLTKPFTLMLLNSGSVVDYLTKCPTCGDNFSQPNIQKVMTCNGNGKPHEVMQSA